MHTSCSRSCFNFITKLFERNPFILIWIPCWIMKPIAKKLPAEAKTTKKG